MIEQWRPPDTEEMFAREDDTHAKIEAYFTEKADPDIQLYWEGIESSRYPFVSAAKVTMTAQNLPDMQYLINQELTLYRRGSWVNRYRIFTDPENYDEGVVREFLTSRPKATPTPTFEPDRETEVNVGKFLLGRLRNLGDPEKSFSQIQREATQDLAMFRTVLGSQGGTERSNLIGRYHVFSYVAGLTMQAFEPSIQPDVVVMPAMKRRSVKDMIAAIDLVAPPRNRGK